MWSASGAAALVYIPSHGKGFPSPDVTWATPWDFLAVRGVDLRNGRWVGLVAVVDVGRLALGYQFPLGFGIFTGLWSGKAPRSGVPLHDSGAHLRVVAPSSRPASLSGRPDPQSLEETGATLRSDRAPPHHLALTPKDPVDSRSTKRVPHLRSGRAPPHHLALAPGDPVRSRLTRPVPISGATAPARPAPRPCSAPLCSARSLPLPPSLPPARFLLAVSRDGHLRRTSPRSTGIPLLPTGVVESLASWAVRSGFLAWWRGGCQGWSGAESA